MSDLRVTNLKGRTAGSAPTLPDGAVVSGILTATTFSVNSAVVSGILTTTSLSVGGVTVSSAGVGIVTAGGIVGTGATLIDFRGAGISTVTVNSGIATINVTGGSGGGYSPTNYIFN